MKNIMVDLETLGTVPGCSILSIGAVAFDPESGELGEEFYVVVRRSSNGVFGLHEDAQTLQWWGSQSDEARQVLRDSEDMEESTPLNTALECFKYYLVQFNLNKVEVWGNGSDFDNAILAVAYQKVGLELPWKFWNNRCYRTLKAEYKGTSRLIRKGTYHNALDDARCQAEHAIQILREKAEMEECYKLNDGSKPLSAKAVEKSCGMTTGKLDESTMFVSSRKDLPPGITPKK